MEEDVARLGVQSGELASAAENVINVRFRIADVHFFEPRYVLPESHVSYRIDRYVPLDWTPSRAAQVRVPVGARRPPKGGKKRSAAERTRAALKSVRYSPLHVKLQNELDDHLRALYGADAVRYEEGWVDLQLHHGGIVTYFEIKTATSAKQCIREAIGQLLEYSTYPDKLRASRIVVVGQEPATPKDDQYIAHLRKEFGIPIRYVRWNWDDLQLEGKLH